MRKILLLWICLPLLAQAQVVRYVRSSGVSGVGGTSWASAGSDLQATINASSPGDEVWVAAGTYSPATPGTSFSLRNGVRVLGGFPTGGTPDLAARDWVTQETILQGNGSRVLLNDPSVGSATLLDGFTITGGAVAGNGGGMLNRGASPKIKNCLFRDNRTDTDANLVSASGGAICNEGGAVFLENCIIRSNTAYTAGGAMANAACSTVELADCLIFSNDARINAGGIINQSIGTLTLTRCRFIRNNTTLLSGTSGGALYNAQFSAAGSRIVNCLFTGNQSNVGPAMINRDVPGLALIHCTITRNTPSGSSAKPKGTILNDGNVTLSMVNSIVNPNFNDTYDGFSNEGTGNSLDVTYSTVKGITTGTGNFDVYTDELFVDPQSQSTQGDYHPRPCSYVIDRGTPVAGLTTDLAGNPRVRFNAPDVGAYEAVVKSTPETDAIVSSDAIAYRMQRPDDWAYYYVGDNCSGLVAAIKGDGSATSVQGFVNIRLRIDASQPAGYVRRNYQISAGSTRTARVTLYFTQAEFDGFNAVSAVKLPTNPGDAAGKANLRIDKRGGTSSDNSGTPDSYPGAPIILNPADSDVVWNNAAARWEVTFAVTGFSGFFVRAEESAPLPLRLVWFGGSRKSGVSALEWQTADERRVSHFEVQRSDDGETFERIGTVTARNGSSQRYGYDDVSALSGVRYYRLMMVDTDGSFEYSRAISLAPTEALVRVGPNPVQEVLHIQTQPSAWNDAAATITHLSGRVFLRFRLTGSGQTVSVRSLPPGVWLLRLPDGHTVRFLKE